MLKHGLSKAEIAKIINRSPSTVRVWLSRAASDMPDDVLWILNARIEDKSMEEDEQEIEKEIQEKGLNEPRLNPDLIDSVIVDEDYHVFKNGRTTVCCLTLMNGFAVIGESSCVSAENFDAEIGRQIARGNAREKVWELEGYLLKEKLHQME